ncbi:hypothetical protein HAX54_004856, partial [Datura stramonium]|nr:hypothetical protein [Datura stramonium]
EDIAKVMGASLARIRTSELQSLGVRVVLGNHPTKKSLVVLAGKAIQGSPYPSGPSVTATPTPTRNHQTQPGRGEGRGSGSTIQGGGQPRLYVALDRRS